MIKQTEFEKIRCAWSNEYLLLRDYHDTEWGAVLYDSQRLFEFLVLEGMQAGLSWYIVLKKREALRKNFDNFDPKKLIHYSEQKIAELMGNADIIRNRRKIASVIQNAGAMLRLEQELSMTFSDYLWDFVDHQPIQNRWASHKDVPSSTSLSDELSKALKSRGFNFVGTTICYAFMQAVGMVNDHTQDCFLVN